MPPRELNFYFGLLIFSITALGSGCDRQAPPEIKKVPEVPVADEPVTPADAAEFEEPLGMTKHVPDPAQTQAEMREWAQQYGGAVVEDGGPLLVLLRRDQVPGFMSAFFGDAVQWLDALRFPGVVDYYSDAMRQAFANTLEEERKKGYTEPDPEAVITLSIKLKSSEE